jgi:hypothetical protein
MAILNGAQAGKEPKPFSYKGYSAPNQYGATAGAVVTSAASTIGLPADYEGGSYSCYLLTCSVPVWVAFTTGTGAATPGGANTILMPTGTALVTVPPLGATSVSVICADAVTTGSFCITGLY